jgi:hypothetical protein
MDGAQRKDRDPEPAELTAKRCARCHYLQIIEAFPVYGVRPSSWCRECWREHNRKRRRA